MHEENNVNIEFQEFISNLIETMAKKPQRDKDRLDEFYNGLKEIHKRAFPDWRFGQLYSNFFRWLMHSKGRDLFFPEEKEMLAYLNEYAKETSRYYEEDKK